MESMLELSKHILDKVSFDPVLFRKELVKFKTWLKKDELLLLYGWCIATYGHQYQELIQEVLAPGTVS